MKRTPILIALLLAAGCGSKPSGQVVARVNGEEITYQDLNAELRGAHVQAGSGDPAKLRAQILQQVIDRILLMQNAQSQKLDRDPDFIADQRRTDQAMLANHAVDQAIASVPAPTPDQVSNYMLANRAFYDGRTVLTIDQLEFATPTDAARRAQIAAANSIAQMLTLLATWKQPFDRSTNRVDTGLLPPKDAQPFLTMPIGATIYSSGGGATRFGAVVERTPMPMSDADRLDLTTKILTQNARSTALKGIIDNLQGTAKIEYQDGFAPPAKPADATH